MLLSSLVLAALVGQACPEPLSPQGPPPCAAANVPGCVPGYRRHVDERGRTVYVCDRIARAPLPAPAAPPVQRFEVPPVAPAPSYAPAYVDPAGNPRRMVGLVFMLGGSTVDRGSTGDQHGALGLELRAPFDGLRMRFLGEYSPMAQSLDASLKYDFNEGRMVRPFLSLGMGVAGIEDDPDIRLTGSISAGVDLYMVNDIFFTLELKQRAFMHDTPRGAEPSSIHQTSILAGVGFYL